MSVPVLSGILDRRRLFREFREIDAAYRAYRKTPLAKAHQRAWDAQHNMPPVGVGNWHKRQFGADLGPCEPPYEYLCWEIDYRRNAMNGHEQCFGCGREADAEPGVLFDWDRNRRNAA